MDTNNQMTDSNAVNYRMVPKAEKIAERELSISHRWRTENSDFIGNEYNECPKLLTT